MGLTAGSSKHPQIWVNHPKTIHDSGDDCIFDRLLVWFGLRMLRIRLFFCSAQQKCFRRAVRKHSPAPSAYKKYQQRDFEEANSIWVKALIENAVASSVVALDYAFNEYSKIWQSCQFRRKQPGTGRCIRLADIDCGEEDHTL
jgi:hypothetical protein